MTPQQFRQYIEKYGFQTVQEAISKKRSQMFNLANGTTPISETIEKLLKLSFPEGI